MNNEKIIKHHGHLKVTKIILIVNSKSLEKYEKIKTCSVKKLIIIRKRWVSYNLRSPPPLFTLSETLQ